MSASTWNRMGAGSSLILLLALLSMASCSSPSPVLPGEIREGVPYTLASTFQVEPGQVQIVEWEETVWPDECLGIPMRDACAENEVRGYRVVVDVGEARYEYRAPASDPLALSLAAAPELQLPEPALLWEGQQDQGRDARCLSLRLYTDARAAFGYCDGPHAVVPLLEGRQREWLALRGRFAPFTYQRPEERLVFRGEGPEEATEAWQRAVAVWAGLLRLETAAGRSSASIGTAFAWQREAADRPGYCDFLTVETYGRTFASRARCEGGDAVNLGDGWLQTGEWEPFDRWYYRFGAAEMALNRATLHFFGQGATAMPRDEAARMAGWAETIFMRLTAE